MNILPALPWPEAEQTKRLDFNPNETDTVDDRRQRQAAERYARARPFVHPLIINRIDARMSGTRPIACALDVGCGTGQSTIALRELASHIIGIDPDVAMLQQAEPESKTLFVVARSECLPCPSACLDLVTVGLAFHCFDQNRFLDEAFRVLRPGGWLVIYNCFFMGRMAGEPRFEEWLRTRYLTRYPSPARLPKYPTSDQGSRIHLQGAGEEEFECEVKMGLVEVLDYLTTQSNITVAVEQGPETIGMVRRWLADELHPILRRKRAVFEFAGGISYWRRPLGS